MAQKDKPKDTADAMQRFGQTVIDRFENNERRMNDMQSEINELRAKVEYLEGLQEGE